MPPLASRTIIFLSAFVRENSTLHRRRAIERLARFERIAVEKRRGVHRRFARRLQPRHEQMTAARANGETESFHDRGDRARNGFFISADVLGFGRV